MQGSLARALALCAALGLCAAAASCNRQTEEQRAKAALEGRNPKGTSSHSLDDRIPTVAATPVGAQPGYVAGAVVYASARAEAVATVWRPLVEARFVDALPALLERGPHERGVLDAFGLDPKARISASLRPIGEASEVPASNGVHLRVHIPVRDRAAFEDSVLGSMLDAGLQERWTRTCAALAPSLVCAGDRSTLVIVRSVADGYVADLFATGAGEPDDESRRGLFEASVELPGGESRPEVEALGGDVVALFDGPGVVEVLSARVMLDVGELELLERLRATERLFDGATVELAIAPERVLARARWLIPDDRRTRVKSVFELDPVDADVPTIAALCEGALACGRSRGLPARHRFAGLATGLYADFDALSRHLDEPEAQIVLALETWPNAIASTASLLGSPDSMLLKNAADVGARVLSFGFSLRSRASSERGRIVYARMNAGDIGTVQTFMQLGGSVFSALTIPGVEGHVESTRSPTSALPDRIYAVHDPGDWGWTVAADADEQIAWLAGLAHDDGAVPMIYVEIPDLGQLLAVDPSLVRGVSSEHVAQCGLRAQMTLTPDWAPELRVAFGRFE